MCTVCHHCSNPPCRRWTRSGAIRRPRRTFGSRRSTDRQRLISGQSSDERRHRGLLWVRTHVPGIAHGWQRRCQWGIRPGVFALRLGHTWHAGRSYDHSDSHNHPRSLFSQPGFRVQRLCWRCALSGDSRKAKWRGLLHDPEPTPGADGRSYAMHALRANGLSAPDGNPVDAVTVDNAGRVGIGTSSPTEALHVAAGDTPTVSWTKMVPEVGLSSYGTLPATKQTLLYVM